jgi:hypothetical protein
MPELRSPIPIVPDNYAVPRGRIKGAAFREFLLWYEIRFAASALATALEGIAPRFRVMLDPDKPAFGVKRGDWYPAAMVHALINGLLDGMSPEERSTLARESGELVTQQTIEGAFRSLFQLIATPERCARHAQRMWRAYYESGTSTVTRVSDTCYTQRVTGWAEHHPFICEMHVAAAVVLYRAMGCQGVRARRIACVSAGATACTSEVTWMR